MEPNLSSPINSRPPSGKFIGTAGWAVPKLNADDVAEAASGLARYATVFNCVEINSSFKQEHQPDTYARWADTVPEGFRFAVKLPKVISHDHRLVGCRDQIESFLRGVLCLEDKLGPLLVQLPPSLAFDAAIVRDFFQDLTSQASGAALVCEPRHPTWFSAEANALLTELGVVRVAADPAIVPDAAEPGGHRDATYIRLHGSPRVYYSGYEEADLRRISNHLRAAVRTVWCIFDNTAAGAAFGNALQVQQLALRQWSGRYS